MHNSNSPMSAAVAVSRMEGPGNRLSVYMLPWACLLLAVGLQIIINTRYHDDDVCH